MTNSKKAEWRSRVTLMAPPVVAEPKKRGRPPMSEEDRAAGKLLATTKRAVKQRELRAAVKAGKDVPMDKVRKSPGPRRLPLEGRVFGELTVMHYEDTIGPRGGRKSRWRLRCSCGVEVVLRTDQLLAKYGRKHCRHARGKVFPPTEVMPGDRKKRGGSGVINPVSRVRKERAKANRAPREWTAAELAERELDAAERVERKRLNAENAERSRRGERMLPAVRKEMDQAGWVRLLLTMRRAGARWADLEMELETASAFGVTREMVEVAA